MSFLNSLLIIYIPALIIIGFLVRKNKRLALNLLYISLITLITNTLLKKLLHTSQEFYPQSQWVFYEFPSLSAQLAITFWLYLSYKSRRIILYIPTILILAFVGYFRITSKGHTMLDVLGGFVFGLLIVFIFIYFENKRKQEKWGRMAIIERFPDPLTPLFQDVIIEVYTHAVRETLKELNLASESFTPTYKIFNGYIYNNFDLKKIPKLKLAKLFIKLYSEAQKTEQRYYQEILPNDQEFLNTLTKVNLKELPNEKLLEYFQETKAHFKNRMIYETVVAYFLESVMKITKLLIKLVLGKESKNYPYLQAIVYQGENESTKIDREIGELVGVARQLNLIDFFKNNKAKEILSSQNKDEKVLKFQQKVNDFINKYHYRLTNYDFIAPTWGESPEIIVEIIKNYLLENIDINDKIKIENEKRKDTLAKIEKVFETSAIKRLLLKDRFYKWLNLAEKYNLLKEARYNSRMMYFYWLKNILLHIGENLLNAGIIEQKSDIFFFQNQELESLVNEKNATKINLVELKSNIKYRKSEKEKQYQLNPPFEFTEKENINWEKELESTKELTGIIANVGKIRGVCKVINNTDEFIKLNKGDILVARTTNPAWTPLFAIAGGVITEVGGLLSHAAIVAREYGIPAMVNVKAATKILKDGGLVEMDANKGVVKILT